jgi:activator of HSP90 ATPase
LNFNLRNKLKTIKQIHTLPSTAEEVFIALTNPFTIELWSGYPAIMSTSAGSEFSLFDGDIVGKNLELIENQLIRQQWYFEGESAESVVTIQLKTQKNETLVELTHTNVPDEVYEEMIIGWKNIYFKSLKQFFK